MKFATATAVVLASALSVLAHAESAVNEAPAQMLALNQVNVTWIAPNVTAPMATKASVEANAAIADLALSKVAEKLERQLEQRLERDLAEQR